MNNRKLIQNLRDPGCELCRLSAGVDDESDICLMGRGSTRAKIMVVGRMPNSREYQITLEQDLIEAGIDLRECYFTSAVKCRNFETSTGKSHIKACRVYLDKEIEIIQPQWILAMGNEALQALTNRSGVTKYRGKRMKKGGAIVIPTLSPLAVSRNPGQRQSYIADLMYFSAQVSGKGAAIPKPKIAIIDTTAKVKRLSELLKKAEVVSFDLETHSTPPGDEFAADARIISLAGTMEVEGRVLTWAIPLYHMQSPFKTRWRSLLRYLAPALEAPPKKVAHNGKYDCRWLRQFGVNMDVTFDTMLAAHLLNENLLKGLKFQVQNRFGVSPWALDTLQLLFTPIRDVLQYNALDAYYTYHLYKDVRAQLLEQPGVARLFQTIMTPANNILIGVERRGVWLDRDRLHTNYEEAMKRRADIDAELMRRVPEDQDEWPKDPKGRPREVNFNPSIFLRWFLFDHIGFPVLKRGKEKEDGREGDPSVAEEVMLQLKQQYPRNKVIKLLMERSKWQKYCSAFLSAYEELVDENDRIHTTFKLYGTVTGRLSSGKADAEKITARAPIRGVNLQQVPRDGFIRSLFGAAPGYKFVEADFSQIELRVAAFLSRDRTMMHLYQTGQDIHTATASWLQGKPASEVTQADRKKAKATNFGFVYGMGARKFVQTAFLKYELVFTEDEAAGIRKVFFEQFPDLLTWHAKQRRMVAKYRRVVSPMGRIRHLPDIDSSDFKVRAEAERQAINSPVQSFASDMTMFSMVLLERRLARAGVEAHFISTVHDALLFEILDEDVAEALPIIQATMENLPLKKAFGIALDVPIEVGIKVGKNWGEARELTRDEVLNWD